ncbi:hypothetical protein BX600DRAFT_506471 [Xylariales sp. PMI_506]|nr:hypothetical protein BX600DRAFT_506471 [Xylariales sp. PMI_506]
MRGSLSDELSVSCGQQLTKVLSSGIYASGLLVFVPVGILAPLFSWPAAVSLTLNTLGLIPLVGLLRFLPGQIFVKTSRELRDRVSTVSEGSGGLLLRSVALHHGHVLLVQESLVGGVVFDMLLATGLFLVCSGVARVRQTDGVGTAQVLGTASTPNVVFLLLSSLIFLSPSIIYYASIFDHNTVDVPDQIVYYLTIVTSTVILLIYTVWLGSPTGLRPSAVNAQQVPFEQAETTQARDARSNHAIFVALVGYVFTISACFANVTYLFEAADAIWGDAQETLVGLLLIPVLASGEKTVVVMASVLQNRVTLDQAVDATIRSAINTSLLEAPLLALTSKALSSQPLCLIFSLSHTIILTLSIAAIGYVLVQARLTSLNGILVGDPPKN